jgi:predicted metal-dependent hydrolase
MHEVTILRSARRSLSIEIQRDLTILVRAPERMSQQEIRHILAEKESWIRAHLEQVRRQQAYAQPPLTDAEVRTLADRARSIVPVRVARFAGQMGVSYGKITIRSQTSRWGSCSARGNLNFNCLLMLCPPEVLDYVVVHELCHRKQMNHSKEFWAEVASVLPEYEKQKNWLKIHGNTLLDRLRQRK